MPTRSHGTARINCATRQGTEANPRCIPGPPMLALAVVQDDNLRARAPTIRRGHFLFRLVARLVARLR